VHGVHVSPSEIEKVILEHPEVADCAVVGVRGVRQSDGFIPRAWLVLSGSAKAKGVDKALRAIEEFARGRLSERQWLQGGFEVIDEVTPLVKHLLLHKRTDISSDSIDTPATQWEDFASSATTCT
jgi:acyl-CoA synthetase (AMP-forming)/AMP-acid ligase II